MNNVNTCATCAIYNGEDCNLSPKLYATRRHDLTCPYFLTREDAPQKCQQCEELAGILARIVEIEDSQGMGVIGWSDAMDDARNAVKMARGES